ncbi:nuclear transport factor 2 family protein [Georgenia ruanii]|uniref:DUF4440 domain-containing protein n=1 Tax=Georgenia ruanii TaxID=348442 RepID=A0A7J9UVB5_9MICO|nr:nuclear transport factor 2 family protein [Georgenia ruanii]MPV88462.1 DUF4440 domain-containing protein [Georgenia ruanii]
MSELTHAEIAELEHTRWTALMRSDLEQLGRLYSDDLVYTHSNGQRDTKESFLELLRSGALRYVRLEPTEQRTRIFGDLAVVSGDVAIEARVATGSHESVVGYTAVWARQGEDIRHVAWHSSPKQAPIGS